MRSSISQETIDYSGKNLTELPPINKAHAVKSLILAKNQLKSIPNPMMFSNLRYLNISNNMFVKLTSLAAMPQLTELDCSFNSITSLDFAQNLPNLQMLYASHNKLTQVPQMPPKLRTLDISFNMISSLKFIETSNLDHLECLIMQNNKITDLRDLKYLAYLTQLQYFSIGFLEQHENSRLLEFVKFICPSLQEFDNCDCGNIMGDFDQYQLISLLANGTEDQLKKLLKIPSESVKWSEPIFLDYEEKENKDAYNDMLEQRIHSLEQRVLKQSTDDVSQRIEDLEIKLAKFQQSRKKSDGLNETGSLLGNDNQNPRFQQIQNDLSEMKKQISKITEILYVHDKAISKLWGN